MSRRKLVALSLVCAIAASAWTPFAQPEPPANVSARAWNATAIDAPVDLIVTAPGFPDLSAARTLPTKEAKTKFVVDALIDHATRAQAQLRVALKGRGKSFTPLWISNQIVVHSSTRADLLWLAARADVAQVDIDEKVKGIEAKQVNSGRWRVNGFVTNHYSPFTIHNSPAAVEWGVQRVNAPQVWSMGFTGQGIVVADLDTGVRWDHAALKPKYRGWNGATADHNYNWFDAAPDTGQTASPAPVDVNGHGTHTVGTVTGDDGAGNQIGVAPGAQWIACRNMASSSGIGSVARYTTCFQFALAPTDVTGSNPDPSKGADITTNSWGCDPDFGEVGCNVPSALITVTQVLRDAGVMVVASAGNSGAACTTVDNAPGTLDQAFTIGASDSGNTIAGFSSRGPSSLTGHLKPDVVAPGVGVRSSTFDSTTSYGFKSGTSMAAPHVAGVVALLWSAAPWLRGDVDATEALLRSTAKPLTGGNTCGGVPGSSVPNNTYGFGLIDAKAAVDKALSGVLTTTLVTTAPVTVRLNEPVTFTLSLANAAAITRTNVVITSGVPASTTVIGSTPAGTLSANTIAWSLPSVAPSTTVTVSFVVSASHAMSLTNAPALFSYEGATVAVTGTAANTFVAAQSWYFPFVSREASLTE